MFWQTKKLGDKNYFEILGSGIDKFEGEKSYLSTSSIEKNIIKTPEGKITYQERPSRANMQPRLNSVWFARMKDTIKVYSFTKENKDEINKYILSTGFAGVLCNTNKVLPKYVEKIFLSKWFNGFKNALASDKAIQKSLNNEDIINIKIPLPPLPEQQKIVYILDSIQDAIRTQEKIIEKTKELNKSMMADLFKYGGPSFRKGRKLKKTEIGEIPENWEVVTIKNIGEVVTGTTPSTLVKDYWNGDIPFVTPTDITKKYVENTERYISQKGLQKARLLPKDSILVTCIASIGKISITPKPCISNQQINAIICKENIDNEYIYYVMNHMSDRLKMWAGQTTSPIVKKSLFEKFILPLPKDKNEQREIAEILQTIDQKIEIEQKKKALYEELFRTMLNKLMTGEIRVDNLKL